VLASVVGGYLDRFAEPADAYHWRFDARTRRLFEAPISATLLRLAAPNVLAQLSGKGVSALQLTPEEFTGIDVAE
jgi:hypothetical protein